MVQRQEFKKDGLNIKTSDWKDDNNKTIPHNGKAKLHVFFDWDNENDYYSVVTTITPILGHYVIREVLFDNYEEAHVYMLKGIEHYNTKNEVLSMEDLKSRGFEYNWTY